jgi:hypothetical protein
MDYQAVFDASQKGYAWWLPFCALFFVLVGIMMRHSIMKQRLKTCSKFMIGGGTTLGVILFLLTFIPYNEAQTALKEKRSSVIEGIVDNFHTGKGESFSVNSIPFRYAAARITPGFNTVRADGGPIRSGIYVRIHYIHIFR